MIDSYVRIWDTESIYNSHDPNYNGKKQLAAISTHSGTIHTVRFSGNNKYLASGADDRIVCIYGLDPNAAPQTQAFGTLTLLRFNMNNSMLMERLQVQTKLRP